METVRQHGETAHASTADRIFADGALSIGLTLPLLRADTVGPDFTEQLSLAKRADRHGFRALWVRDVPLNSPDIPTPWGTSTRGCCSAHSPPARGALR